MLVLDTRETVSNIRDRLTSYFEARGVSVSEPAAGSSKILLGLDLGDSVSSSFGSGEQGEQGEDGEAGEAGEDGEDGEGVPVGGTTGQVLVKSSNSDFDTEWDDVEGVGSPVASDVTSTPSGNLAAVNVQTALNELQSDIDTRALTSALTAHIDDTAGAHAASAISNSPSGSLAASTVQAALDELQTDINTRALASGLSDHLADSSDAHGGSAITNVASGNLSATTVQGALNELQSDLDTRATSSALSDHLSDASDAHAASAVTNTPSGNLSGTTVQSALNELQSDIDGRAASSHVHSGADITTGTVAYARLGLTGNVVAADIAASAGIPYSKLSLGTSILNADLAGSIAYSKLSLTGALLNADLAGSIALTKLLTFGSGWALPNLMSYSGAAQTDTTGGLVSASGYSWAIGASEVWAFFFWLQHGCDNTGGIKYGINGPSGATLRAMTQGATTGVTAQSSVLITALNTVTAIAYNTVNSQGGRAMISGRCTASSTPGTMQLQFCAGTSTQTATLYSESMGIAVRVS